VSRTEISLNLKSLVEKGTNIGPSCFLGQFYSHMAMTAVIFTIIIVTLNSDNPMQYFSQVVVSDALIMAVAKLCRVGKADKFALL